MSYIVTEKGTLNAVCELWKEENAQAVNREKYDVYTAYDYLTKFNASLKQGK